MDAYINVPIPGSSGTPQLNAALAKAQGSFLPIIKSKTVNVTGKDGRAGYTFVYAELSDVIAATVPALSKNEIAVSMANQCKPPQDKRSHKDFAQFGITRHQ